MNELTKLLYSFPDKPWDWSSLSRHPNLFSSIEKYRHLPWDWDSIVYNPEVDIDTLINSPEFEKLNYHTLSYNRSLTSDFVVKTISKNWNWERISGNTF